MMEYLACFLFGAVVALTGVKVGSFTNGGERQEAAAKKNPNPQAEDDLSLIHISEPTRP